MRMTGIRIEPRRGVILAGLVLIVGACSSGGAGAGASAAAPSAAAPSAAAVASAAASGGGRYGSGSDDYGSPASGAPAPSASDAGAAGESYEVKVGNGAVGAFLTGEDGKTLYIFKKDSPNKSVCAGDCATNWPAFTVEGAEAATPGDGVKGALTTFARADGAMQVAYNGAPLYYFAADTAAGDTNGQGVGGVWFVATP